MFRRGVAQVKLKEEVEGVKEGRGDRGEHAEIHGGARKAEEGNAEVR